MMGYQEMDLKLAGKINLGICKKELTLIYISKIVGNLQSEKSPGF